MERPSSSASLTSGSTGPTAFTARACTTPHSATSRRRPITSVPKLLEQLTSGKSLADVAKAEDKSVDGLKKAMVADAKKRLDQAVEAGMLTEAQAKEKLDAIESKIDDIVNGKFPDRGERHFRWRGGPPDNGAWRLPPAA